MVCIFFNVYLQYILFFYIQFFTSCNCLLRTTLLYQYLIIRDKCALIFYAMAKLQKACNKRKHFSVYNIFCNNIHYVCTCVRAYNISLLFKYIFTFTEFQKEVIRKLKLLLNKMIALENRMILLETSNTMQHNNREAADVIQYEEYDLPLRNMQTLQ